MTTTLNASHQHHQRSLSTVTIPSTARKGLLTSSSPLNAQRFLAKLSANFSSQPTVEQKMAELRAAYASPAPTQVPKPCSLTPGMARRNGPTRASLPTPTIGELLDPQFGSRSTTTSRRGSAIANCMPSPSIMELATSAGLLSLSPSDLVFESSVFGIAYYDFVLSVSEVIPSPDIDQRRRSSTRTMQADEEPTQAEPGKRRVRGTGSEPNASETQPTVTQARKKGMLWKQRPKTALGNHPTTTAIEDEEKTPMASIEKPEPDQNDEPETSKIYRLFLVKLDSHTNVEWFESVVVPSDLLTREGIPPGELSLLTMGVLVWRARLHNARLLCLAGGALNNGDDNTVALEALKRAACKFKCMHHVLTLGARRPSAASTCSSASNRSSNSSGSNSGGYSSHSHQQQDPGMKLRILMCQSRNELSEVPAQALRDTKFLLAPSSNPLLCLCFPLT